MTRQEQGYTLVEVLVAFFIMGVMISFSLPIITQVKQVTVEQALIKESYSFMQETAARLQADCVRVRHNHFVRQSYLQPQVFYIIKWQCYSSGDRLWNWMVEAQWKQNGEQKKASLSGNGYH